MKTEVNLKRQNLLPHQVSKLNRWRCTLYRSPSLSLLLVHDSTYPHNMSSKSKSKQEEALQLLDQLDSLSTAPVARSPGRASTDSARQSAGEPPPPPNSAPNEDAADVLQFIDEITQKSSEPTRTASRAGTPTGTVRRTTERIRVGSPAPSLHAREGTSASATAAPVRKASPEAAQAQTQGQGGWGWGSVWTSASAALQQAKSAVEENVKALPNNEQAKKWSEGVMGFVPVNREQLEKFSTSMAFGRARFFFED